MNITQDRATFRRFLDTVSVQRRYRIRHTPQIAGISTRAMARMRATTVRFSERLWRLIETQAELEGVSASEYIRESVLARAIVDQVARDGPQGWERALSVVRELLADED